MSAVTTSLGICNMALNHLGQKKIAALDDNSETGRKCNLLYDTCVDEVLRDVKPNFAKKRAIFHHVVDAEISISGATQADPVVITAAAHGLSNGNTIAIWDVGGMTDLNGKLYKIANVTSSTFELTDVNGNDIDGTDYDAYTSGGKCGLKSAEPAFGFTYRYLLPSDYVNIMEINGNDAGDIDHSVEGGEILTNESELQARYIYQNTNVSNWDANFKFLVSYKLAYLLASAITSLSSQKKEWEETYEKEKAKTKGQKSQESGTGRSGPPRRPIIDGWTGSRRS